jgi:hypothetical protein
MWGSHASLSSIYSTSILTFYHKLGQSVEQFILFSPPNMDVWRLHCVVSESERSPELELPTTLRHGEAVFGLSRLREDANGVGPPAPGMSARSAQ